MNAETLLYESDHVREEHEKLRRLLGVEEATITRVVEAFLAQRRGEPVVLPGSPADDAPTLAWIDYFLGVGAVAVFSTKVPVA